MLFYKKTSSRESNRGGHGISMKIYPYITITSGMSGYFAVMIWWNPALGGFEEPFQTGVGRYKSLRDAVREAKSWSKDEGLPYYGPKYN